jgi:hypothetical protein
MAKTRMQRRQEMMNRHVVLHAVRSAARDKKTQRLLSQMTGDDDREERTVIATIVRVARRGVTREGIGRRHLRRHLRTRRRGAAGGGS